MTPSMTDVLLRKMVVGCPFVVSLTFISWLWIVYHCNYPYAQISESSSISKEVGSFGSFFVASRNYFDNHNHHHPHHNPHFSSLLSYFKSKLISSSTCQTSISCLCFISSFSLYKLAFALSI